MKKINLEFGSIARSKCLKAITSIISDPRLNGESICLYFSLLRKINGKGVCKIRATQDSEVQNIRSLQKTGYISFVSKHNLLIIDFNAI